METLQAKQQYFQDCLQCLAYTEDVFRLSCMVSTIQLLHKTQIELKNVLKCTLKTEKGNVKENGWPSAVLEHECSRNQACNKFILDFFENLPSASKLNRTEVLKAICQTDVFEFTKLFLEPWMCTFSSVWEMDVYCLILLLANVSFFYRDRPARRAFYQQHIEQMRKLTESCLYEDVENMTKADRDVCLQAIINALVVVDNRYVDKAIQRIQELICMNTSDTQMKKETLDVRSDLKWTINEFQQEVIRTASDILQKAIDDRQDSNGDEEEKKCFTESHQPETDQTRRLLHYRLVQSVVDRLPYSELKELFSQQIIESLPVSSHRSKNVSSVKYKYAQAVVYYLEKAKIPNEEVCSLLEALTSPGSTGKTIRDKHIATLKEAVERQEHASSIQEIVYSEMNAAYFKMCYQVVLSIENGLRQHCKRKMYMIHNAVTEKFPRKRLCQLADKYDMIRVNDSPSAEIIYINVWEKEPECNTFFNAVLSQRTAKCMLTPQTMFRNVKPQNCIDNVWDFTKLFLEPCMHMFKGFEDLDAFCLLTLLANVQMFDGNQSEEETFLSAVLKARDGALKVLQSSKQELTKQTMESFFEASIFILERCMFPGSDRLIKQIKEITNGTSLPLLDIRLSIESKRQQNIKKFYDKSIFRDKNEGNWYRSALALKSVLPPLITIVKQSMEDLHKDAENRFGGKLCLEANADDIIGCRKRPVKFKHKCSGSSSVNCNDLLKIIKEYTAQSADLLGMLRGTNPHTWLSSPFGFTCIYLNHWMRLEMKKFEDCDVGALFCLIKQCQPLRRMFNVEEKNEDIMKPLRAVRNRLMHCSLMETSEQEMEEAIELLLKMLGHIEHRQVGSEVTEAIKELGQIKTDEIRLLRHDGMQLLQEVMADLKRKRMQQEDLINMIRKNIKKIEKVLGIPETCSEDTPFDGHEAEDGTVAEKLASQGFLSWCRCVLALKYLQLMWVDVVEREMNFLHSKTLSNLSLCSKAKSTDLTSAQKTNRLIFKHKCTYDCHQILDVIQDLYPASVSKLAMLKDTDPQTWSSSPFEFTRLFLKKWRRSGIEQFRHCDISALCQITKTCQPLLEKMDGTLVNDVRSVRNTTVHSPTMEMSQQKMEDNIDVVLTFIQYLKRNFKFKADEDENMLRTLDFTRLHREQRQLLKEFVSDMRRDVTFKEVETSELSKKITEMETTVSNIISEGTLPGKQFTDSAGRGDGKRRITSMHGQFDRITIVDLDDDKKKEQERLEKEEMERKEQERLEKKEKERKEQERLEKEEKERKEQERLEKEEKERKEQQRLEKEEKERKEQERLEKEEKERKEQERLEKEEKERKEQKRLEKEEMERKLRTLNEEKRKLADKIKVIDGQIEQLTRNIRRLEEEDNN